MVTVTDALVTRVKGHVHFSGMLPAEMAIAEIAEEANAHTGGTLSEAGGQNGAMHAPLSGQHAGAQSPTAGQSVPGMTAHRHQGARLLQAAPAAAAVTAAAAVVDHRPQAQTVAAAVKVTVVRNERHVCQAAAEEAQQPSKARRGQQPVARSRAKAFSRSSSSSSSSNRGITSCGS